MNNVYPIGTALTFVWRFMAPDNRPFVFDPTGQTLRLRYYSGRGTKDVSDFIVTPEGDGVTWTITPDEEFFAGKYSLVLDVIEGDRPIGQFHYKDAFTLYQASPNVLHSQQGEDETTVSLLSVGEFYLFAPDGVRGKSAYEIAREHGYTGTEEEWLQDPVNGIKGNGVASFELIGDFDPAPSANNTYRITPNVGDPFDFIVKNGVGLTSVDADESTADSGTSTYTMHFSDGTDQVVIVKNGTGIVSIEQITVSQEDGGTNVVRINMSDGRHADFQFKNGTKGNTGSSIAYPFEVYDGIDSTDAEKALSAKQGKVLKDYVDDNTLLQESAGTPVGETPRFYITDKNQRVLGYIDTTGAMNWLAKTEQQAANEKKLSRLMEEIEVEGYDNYAFLTDENRCVIGYITNKGGVFFYNLLNEVGGGAPNDVTRIMEAVANGGYNDVTLNFLNNSPKKTFTQPGHEYKTHPFISFTDDDAFDVQIPETHNWQAGPNTPPSAAAATNGVGFVSILYPFVKSINERYRATMKGRASFGIAAEGQRIGLTGLYKDTDQFDGSLNLGGRLLKSLAAKAGWNIICHSMTARYIANSYWVESMSDPLVAEIEAAADTNHPQNEWHLSYIHCADTNIDYEYRSTGWHVVSDQYIRPYLAKTLAADAPLFFNPRYSHKYQVEEWKKRAIVAGLPISDCLISWGSSPCKKFLIEDFKYFNNVFLSPGNTTCNDQPLNSSVMKRVAYPSANNAWDDAKHASLIAQVDNCVNNGSWLVFMAHSYDNNCKNCYLDGVDYGARRDDNYPEEWIVPLKYEELKTMDENNYWEVPPARLGISSWGEWYPCPGTTYDMLLDVVEYAISQGVEFGSVEEGIARFKNIFNIGLKFTSQSEADRRLDPSEVESWWDNHVIQQNDGSILYNVN